MLLLIPAGVFMLVLGFAGVGAGDAVSSPPGSTIRLSPHSDDDVFPTTYDALDALEARTVLRVRVEGFEPYAAGLVKQCVYRAQTVDCGNEFPVQFDADGKALFQYEVHDDFHASVLGAGGCRARAARCTLVVQDRQRGTRAGTDTVFYDELPTPGVIRVEPSSGLVDGETVTVAVVGYPAGAQVNAMMCAAPAASGSQRCGAPGPTAPLLVGPDGTGSTELVVDQGPVGSERVPCGRGAVCGISVASGEVFARAPVVPISFAPPAGATYDSTHLAIGLGLAGLFIGIAVWFICRTDWSPVGEAAAPEIDDAEYADLDAIVAALPPEDDDELARSP